MSKIKIGIVVADFNNEITLSMLNEAKKHAEEQSIMVTYVCFVPGVFDMPLVVKEMLKKKDVDTVVTLGAVIKGETGHDRVIANNTARLLGDLSLKYNKPIALGITGPEMTFEQAKDRIIPVSHHAINTAIYMVIKLRKIKKNRLKNKEIKIID
ncbi:MAG: 6,7-dimethyl-8-ribityllumazine synthase [Nitrosopumilus sp.]|nr:6,7-dimethyl-8-ribityllumazine synthase [Nitrosopumilus sp.]